MLISKQGNYRKVGSLNEVRMTDKKETSVYYGIYGTCSDTIEKMASKDKRHYH